jgi:alpha-tubulin suppressor-like RCC1 family protein
MRSLLHITVAGLALLRVATMQATPTVVQASAGWYHTLFVESDGSLWAMGANGNGQLGDGTTTERHVPVMIEPSNVVAVAAGLNFSLFLTSDGNLWAMGANGNGQLGDGTTTEQHRPEQIVFTGGVTAISAGGAHSLFLKTNVLWGMSQNATASRSQIPRPWERERMPAGQVRVDGEKQLTADYADLSFQDNAK